MTKEQIEIAKVQVASKTLGEHFHDDCIRIVYEWLDAQKKRGTNNRDIRGIKHLVERWANRYVSRDDVVVAAHMHPDITGEYPHFNISTNLIEPSFERLKNIKEAFTGRMGEHNSFEYKYKE